jgi:hypothetical protein
MVLLLSQQPLPTDRLKITTVSSNGAAKKMASSQQKDEEEDVHARTANVPFRQEIDEMERDGSINVWPYRVRRELSVSQRRIQNARAYVADRDNNNNNKRKAEEESNQTKPTSTPSVKFLPAAKLELTEAQKIVSLLLVDRHPNFIN